MPIINNRDVTRPMLKKKLIKGETLVFRFSNIDHQELIATFDLDNGVSLQVEETGEIFTFTSGVKLEEFRFLLGIYQSARKVRDDNHDI